MTAVAAQTRTLITRLRGHIRRTELRLLLAGLAVFGSVWGFLYVLDEVQEGDALRFDSQVLLAFRQPGRLAVPIGPRWLQETARDITALGGFTVLALVVVLAAALLWAHRRRAQAGVLVVAVVGGDLLDQAIKAMVGRTRPDLVPHLDLVYSASFPSGHSAMSPVVYFTLAGLVAAGEGRRASKMLLIATALLLVIAIGVSRVYLGVHWPTDVLGGWALGTAVAMVATLALHLIAPHRRTTGAVAAVTRPQASAAAPATEG
jgi:undecaprenyl-diphosphatase